MALQQKYFLLLVALVAVNLIFAQESDYEADYNPEDSQDSSPPNEENQNEEGSSQGRLFFSRYVACNYTAQAGRTCANCRQTLRCLPSNIGILRTCYGFLRYCNGGVCSWIPGSECTSG